LTFRTPFSSPRLTNAATTANKFDVPDSIPSPDLVNSARLVSKVWTPLSNPKLTKSARVVTKVDIEDSAPKP